MINTIIKDKEVTLYPSDKIDAPLIVIHLFEDDKTLYNFLTKKINKPFSLLTISHLNWDDDMSPWIAPALFKGDHGCGGKANEYLDILLNDILPWSLHYIQPSYKVLTGYSLAGLFAIYTMYQTDIFSKYASASGSFWFPSFLEYTISHEMKSKPDKLYFSLGDKEARTRHQLLKTVEDNTLQLVKEYKEKGITTIYESNPGNHVQDVNNRIAKAIASMLETHI